MRGLYVNPFDKTNDDGLTGTGHSILANMGIMPTYYYENSVNKVVFMLKLKSVNMLLKIAFACLAAFLSAAFLKLLPDAFTLLLSGYVFIPASNIISALL